MFSLILSVGLSILLSALDFGLAPLQTLFMMDVTKQTVMDQVDDDLNEVVSDLFTDIFDDIF